MSRDLGHCHCGKQKGFCRGSDCDFLSRSSESLRKYCHAIFQNRKSLSLSPSRSLSLFPFPSATRLIENHAKAAANFPPPAGGEHSFTHELIHSLCEALTQSFIHSLTHSLTHLLTHSLSHSLKLPVRWDKKGAGSRHLIRWFSGTWTTFTTISDASLTQLG